MARRDIDVILRTFNRAALLQDAIASFFAADHSGIAARLIVVDNASSDDTEKLLAAAAARYGEGLLALRETKVGGQHALNCGLASADASIIAFFDDDERIAPDWLQVIAREFVDPATDYIAGPVAPITAGPLPDWLPGGFGGVLGIIDNGPDRRRYGAGFAGMLTQGNCALRRSVFDETGPYPEQLPTAEDRWLFDWLVRNGKAGFYCPDLIVRHIMQPERITRSYFRDWAQREGRDRAICDRLAGTPPVIARPWYWREISGSALRWLLRRGGVSGIFRDELSLRIAASYVRQWFRL